MSGTATIEYNGPRIHADAWHAFAHRYAGMPGNIIRIQEANLLNALAFKTGAVKSLMEAHKDDRHLQQELGHVAHKVAKESIDKSHRPLHKAIVGALTDKWIALEGKKRLYPPVTLASGEKGGSLPQEETNRITRQREDFLRDKSAALLANTLMMLHKTILQFNAREVYKTIEAKHLRTNAGHPISRKDVKDAADTIFYSSLFNFNKDKGSSFPTYLAERLKRLLLSETQKAKKMRRSLSLDHASPADDGSWAASVVDTKSQSAIEKVVAEETITALHEQIDALDERERAVVTLNHLGLGNNGKLSMSQIAKLLGVSKSMVGKISDSAMGKLRQGLMGFSDNEHASPGGPTAVERLKKKSRPLSEPSKTR